MIEQAWLIPVIPLVAFFLIAFFGKRSPGQGAGLGILAVGVSWVLSLIVAFEQIGGEEAVERSWPWLEIGSFRFEIGTYVDGLAAMMLIVVTTVSLLVHVYSLGYMRGDRRFTWFYAVLSLFTGSMLNLVLANNLWQLLIGWELVGICSYLLIGHWWEEKENSSAAIKAFITTKTGDVPFQFGIFALVIGVGSANIQEVTRAVEGGELSTTLTLAAALLLFGGAIGKSAQFPLHVWLPDAMAGPTPVSALIHAATMVVAGIYLVGRMFLVFEAAAPEALTVVAVIAAITMLIAAVLAAVQDDIKRVLAYSTVSQLAYMMAGLGVGEAGYTAGFFHLFTHAFFKALLFLAAGSIIHAVHTNNMSEMGGLRRHMPWTFWTFVIGAVALAGIPPLAGFWSKDEIITAAYAEGQIGLWIVALITAALTAFYMTRAVLLTFFGRPRHSEEVHPHESPPVMVGPLAVLAGLSLVIGFVNAPFVGWFSDWVFVHEPHHAEFSFFNAGLSLLIALGAIALGVALYGRYREREPLRRLGPVYAFAERKYFLDDIYMGGIVEPVKGPIARGVYWTNQHILDGLVNAAGWIARKLGRGTEAVDRNVVDGIVNRVGVGTGWTGGLLRYVQSGNVQRYAIVLFAGVAILAVIFTRI
ncbi:MAG TPA: NADH-quinone oxidoreductase subunit L, partial [Actinomycetota bacterium]